MSDILILHEPIDAETLDQLAAMYHGDMVKYVVDLERSIIAIGGEFHADAKAILLEEGSRHPDLWGANYYPGQPEATCIEYTSLINISPARGNPGMELFDTELRDRVREATYRLIGRGKSV
ncbi:MAG: DUF5674 family protein [Candidatus Eisenbacteria bacterium]|nr:DUF5674 family protein [Candidatus Eisenbacteria bacterium]